MRVSWLVLVLCLGGCTTERTLSREGNVVMMFCPLGCLMWVKSGQMEITAIVKSEDGKTILEAVPERTTGDE